MVDKDSHEESDDEIEVDSYDVLSAPKGRMTESLEKTIQIESKETGKKDFTYTTVAPSLLAEEPEVLESQEEPTEPKVPSVAKKEPYRLCLNYKPINSQTIVDKYPLPNINLIFTKLGQAKYFSIFDAFRGYWQAPLDPESRNYIAFITPHGLWHWKVLPMGLQGAPSYWQRAMDKIFHDMKSHFMIYLDDGLTYSNTFEEHLSQLDKVLQRVSDYNMSLSKTKCKFGY